MADKKPTLVIVTSRTCHACALYKQKSRNKIIESVKQYVDIQEKDFTDIQRESGLSKYVGWFPSFILIPPNSIDKPNIDAIVMGGNIVDGKIKITDSSMVGFDSNKVLKWVKDNVNSSLLQEKKYIYVRKGNKVKTSGKNSKKLNSKFVEQTFD